MSILTQIASGAAIPAEAIQPESKTMQDVHSDAIKAGKNDEAKAIKRLSDFFAKPLKELPASAEWFDELFALAKSHRQVPGQDRNFWKSLSAFNKWRNKVRRRIEYTLGEVEKEKERKARHDGWLPLLELMTALSKDGGPIHTGEVGAIAAFADRARELNIEPLHLERRNIELLLDRAASEPLRRKNIRALQVLKRYHCIQSIASHLPPEIEIDAVRRRFENILPSHVDDWVERVLETARRDPKKYDQTTGKYADEWVENTVANYRSALRTYIWSASKERSGQVDLDTLTDFSTLASKKVFYGVVAHWNDFSEQKDGLTARTAYGYVTRVATVLGRNGMEVAHMVAAKKTSDFLKEGEAAGEEMSPKNIAFCRPLVDDPRKRRQFLTQHLEYRRRAADILATDKVLPSAQLRLARMFGTCAAFAAVELCGSPLRVTNALQLRHRGPTSNLFLPKGNDTHFLVVLDAREMKVQSRRHVPQVKIRRNALEGAQTLEWYRKTIRPLFPYGNADWCPVENPQPLNNVRFGKVQNRVQGAESVYFFVAPQSAAHLSKSLFYEWISEASAEIGMPMTAHNFRHGLASILLKRSLANLDKVAKFLGNTPAVVQRNYAWINVEAVIEETQDDLLNEALG